VTGTTVSSTQVNSRFSDIENEITNSLDRSGRGGFLASFRTVDGTVAAPAHSFTNEPGTGLYRVGASNPALAVNGAQAQSWTSTGTTFPGTLGVTGNTTVGGTLGVTGATTLSSTLGVTGATTLNGTLSQSVAGTGSTPLTTLFEPALATGNFVSLAVGSAAGANASGALLYTSNATPALSTFGLGLGRVPLRGEFRWPPAPGWSSITRIAFSSDITLHSDAEH
jgi:hypothetical protein